MATAFQRWTSLVVVLSSIGLWGCSETPTEARSPLLGEAMLAGELAALESDGWYKTVGGKITLTQHREVSNNEGCAWKIAFSGLRPLGSYVLQYRRGTEVSSIPYKAGKTVLTAFTPDRKGNFTWTSERWLSFEEIEIAVAGNPDDNSWISFGRAKIRADKYELTNRCF
jgi:hypothetical protein